MSTKSPQPEVFRGVKRMDVLDGASVSVRWLFSQSSGMGRHWRDPSNEFDGSPDGDRSYFREKVGWFLCKMGVLNFGLAFA